MNDTANHWRVRSPDDGHTLFFETNTPSPILVRLRPEEALNLAAWLLAIADPTWENIARQLWEIRKDLEPDSTSLKELKHDGPTNQISR